MRLLLVEDEPEMAAALSAVLLRYDMVVDHARTKVIAEEAILSHSHDAVLLDRKLPDGDGIDLVPLLRKRHAGVPVIIISARGSIADKIEGLDTGADDYLPKPFAVEELLARLRAVLRRPMQVAPDSVQLGSLSFDLDSRQARVGETAIELPRRELLVLECLLRRSGRTVLRASLEDAVYGYGDEIQSNSLDAHISRLRRKLADARAGVEIHGIRGVGYLIRAVA
jgi:DNA-binding response OmpR family regulator